MHRQALARWCRLPTPNPEKSKKRTHWPPRRSAGSTRVEGTSISTPRAPRLAEKNPLLRAFEGCCMLPLGGSWVVVSGVLSWVQATIQIRGLITLLITTMNNQAEQVEGCWKGLGARTPFLARIVLVGQQSLPRMYA